MKFETTLPDEVFSEVESFAAAAQLTREEYIAQAIVAFNERRRRKALRDANVTAAYDAIADAPEMQLSPVRKARRNARWKELGEW